MQAEPVIAPTVRRGRIIGAARRVEPSVVRSPMIPRQWVHDSVLAPNAEPRPHHKYETPRRWIDLGALVLADVVTLIVAALVTDPLNACIIFVAAVFLWESSGLYSRRFALSILEDAPALALGVMFGVGLAALVTAGNFGAPALAAVMLLGGALVTRAMAYAVIRQRRRQGLDVFPTVLLGKGPTAAKLIDGILAHPETGIRVVGLLDEVRPTPQAAMRIPYLGRARDLDFVLRRHQVSNLIVCDSDLPSSGLVDLLRAGGQLEIDIHVVPALFQIHRLVGTTDKVWGVPLERVRGNEITAVSRWLKRLMDVVFSSLALLVLLPVMAAVALAVRRELGPGVFYRQERVGMDGRRFSLRKFRSMPVDVCPADETTWSTDDDVRLGPVARFIRAHSLDEIPQLLNVLVGDMSLVGPRPERPQFVKQFANEVTGYGHRHRVPAGVTGLAAVEGLRGDTSVSDRAYFDNCYIENWSLWLDMKILIRTVMAVLRGAGG